MPTRGILTNTQHTNTQQTNTQTNTNTDGKGAEFVQGLYDGLGYLDLYSNSVVLVALATLLVLVAWAFAAAMQVRGELADDWAAQRCKPQNLPFAGWIYHPEGTTPLQYTQENFQYCTQSILKDMAGYALQPLQYSVQTLTAVFGAMADTVQSTRQTAARLRTGVADIGENVMQRLLSITAPLQTMLAAVLDTFQKIQGVATASVYTMLGSYLTLQALMGAVMDLIIKILIALTVLIAGLWMVPFSWPAATAMTAVFLGISVPMALILAFMKQTLHIQSGGLPKAPKAPKLRCFAGSTTVPVLHNGVVVRKRLDAVQVGDVLPGPDGRVTCMLQLSAADLPMYTLHGVCCSGTHLVQHKKQWIRTERHPDAAPLPAPAFADPFVYCLNTQGKTLHLSDLVFRDWDEMDDDVHARYRLGYPAKHTWVCTAGGAPCRLDQVRVGDVLADGQVVYGLVLLAHGHKHLLTTNKEVCLHDPCDGRCVTVGDFDAAVEAKG